MLDMIIISLYCTGMIAVGLHAYLRGRASSSDGFFVAERRGGTLLMAGSLCATFMGSSVVIGMAGRGYRMGLPGAWWLLVGAAGLFILGFFLARKVRSFGGYTLPELIERQYGATTSMVASLLIVVAWIAVIAAQIVAAGKTLAVLLPYDSSVLMVIAAFVFVLYTALGGQYSIIRTDFLQFGILTIGILVSLGLVLNRSGGISGLTAALPPEYLSFPVNASFGWYELILFLILTGSTYVVGPDIYSRLFCARNEKTAKLSAVLAGSIAIPIAFLIVLTGMGALVLFPDLPSLHPDLSTVQASELAFPTIIQDVLPVGISGLVMAALLAAIMSSADTCLLTTSTILSVDIYKRIFPQTTDRRILLISRIGIAIIGAFALLVALSLKGIISSLFLAYTIFTSGIVIPVIAGFYRDKLSVNSAGALAAIIGGGGTALLVKLVGGANMELLGFAVCGILFFGVSWLTNRSH